MARLILSKDGRERSIVLAAASVSLGRAPDCTIVLEDNAASKRHCSIEKVKGAYVLRDLGSTNGTFLNERQVIADMPLRHGDEIVVGDTQIRFEDGYAVGSSIEPPAEGVVLARLKLRKRPVLAAEAPKPASLPPTTHAGDPPSSAKHPIDGPPAPDTAVKPATPAESKRQSLRMAPVAGPASAVPPAPHSLADLLEPIEATTRLDSLPELLPWVEPEAPPPPPDRLLAFFTLTRSLLAASEPADLLEALLRGALALAPVERGAVFRIGPDGEPVAQLACDRHGVATAAPAAGTVVESVVARRASAVVQGAKGGDAAAIPLVFRAVVRGVLWLEAPAGTTLGDADVDLLALAAAQAATFLAALDRPTAG